MNHTEDSRAVHRDMLLPLHHREADPEKGFVCVEPSSSKYRDVQRIRHESAGEHAGRLAMLRGRQSCDRDGHSFLGLQLTIIGLHKITDLVTHIEQLLPLLLVQSHRKSTEPIDGNTTFFTDFQTDSP